MPSSHERLIISAHVAALRRLTGTTPATSADDEKASILIVTKLLMTLGGARAGEDAAEAKGEAYMAALDDVPAWAVAEAARRWYRGDCGHTLKLKDAPHNYSFPPSPATLRTIARLEVWRFESRARELERIINAVALIEYSEEHCRTMREKLVGVVPWLFTGAPA